MRRRTTRNETRSQRKLRYAHIRKVFETAASDLNVDPRLKALKIRGEYDGVGFTVGYWTGGGEVSLPPDRCFIVVTTQMKWNDRRITINRGRELSTESRIARLERKLNRLSPARSSIVVEALTEIPDHLTLTRSRMTTRLPPGSDATAITARVKQMISFVRRLAATLI